MTPLTFVTAQHDDNTLTVLPALASQSWCACDMGTYARTGFGSELGSALQGS